MGDNQEFRPERFSRRGEFTAWGLAIISAAIWALLAWREFPVPGVLKFVAGFTLLAGLAISLTNWMDRVTVLRLEPGGVYFSNGLRRVRLRWDEIREIKVFPSNFGDQVRVVGERTFFSFRTYAEARMGTDVRGRMGFAEGEKILAHIRREAGLTKSGEGRGIYSYTRETP